MILGLFGCGQQKYKLELDGYGFSSDASSYAEGEMVKVVFGLIATDTNYSFYLDCEDTDLKVNFENEAYILTFRMPAHDVKLSVSEKNTMVYMLPIVISLENQVKPADIWIMEDTNYNRKLSTWGGATIKECPVGSPLTLTLENVSDDCQYIVRMIDKSGLFYEAGNVEITDGQSIVIKSEDGNRTLVSVYDRDGSLQNEYEMFVAAL